jgi:hypothetical protein
MAAGLVTALGSLATLAVAGDIGYRGWGPRVGLASDPDQALVGAHLDLGEFARDVRFWPNVELGLGDDHAVVALTAPVHYVWRDLSGTSAMPYAGGGIALAYVDPDEGDSDVELGGKIGGGAGWRLAGGTEFFAELNLGLGDIHDFEVVVGWLFRP